METFRSFRDVPVDRYEVVRRPWRVDRPEVIRLHDDLRIAGVPCRAGHDLGIFYDPPVLRVGSAWLAERYLVPLDCWGGRVVCERDTLLAFRGWLFARAATFTPVHPLVVDGFPLAAGHEVSLLETFSGTLGRDHRIGWLDVPAGSRVEVDVYEPYYVDVKLCHEVQIKSHTIAPGARVRIWRRRLEMPIEVFLNKTRTCVDRAGRVVDG